MRKLYSTLVALAAAALALPGAAHAQANKLVVGLPTTPPNVVHMPVIVAKELGLYKKYGVDVETVQLEDGVKVFRAMLAGNIDVGMSPGAVTIIGVSNGAAVKTILANSNKFEASMIVRDNIKTMADLKGKRIGIQQPGGFADLLEPQRVARGQDRSQGRQLRHHRQRRRAGAGRRPGRHRDPACRAGDAGEEQGAEPARHRAHVGCAAKDALHGRGGDGKNHQGQAGGVGSLRQGQYRGDAHHV